MMMKLSMGCIHLEILDLNGVTQIRDDSVKIITHYCKKLKIIRLKQCFQLSDVSILAISSNNTNLQELDVSRTQLGILMAPHHAVTFHPHTVCHSLELARADHSRAPYTCRDPQVIKSRTWLCSRSPNAAQGCTSSTSQAVIPSQMWESPGSAGPLISSHALPLIHHQ